MNPKNSHKMIAMGGMAAVIAVGVVMFKTEPHATSSVTEAAAPPPLVAQTAGAAASGATPPGAAPAAIAPLPEAPAAAARDEGVGARTPATSIAATLGPTPVRSRSVAKANGSAAVTGGKVASGGSGASNAPETVANRAERLMSADVLTRQPSPSSSATDDAKAATSAVPIASDSQITTDVKTAIAGDIAVKDLNIGVSTSDGVVALTGSVATQGAIDQAKDVAGKVKDVKRVDTTALVLASL